MGLENGINLAQLVPHMFLPELCTAPSVADKCPFPLLSNQLQRRNREKFVLNSTNKKNHQRLQEVRSSLDTGREGKGVRGKHGRARAGKKKKTAVASGEWAHCLRGGIDDEQGSMAMPKMLKKERPYKRLGHGSGGRKDNGLSMAQEWKRHETDGAIERRVEAKLAKLREEQDARDFMRNRKESANPCGSEAIEQQWNSHVAKMEEQELEFKQKAQMAQSRALEAEWQPRVFATVPAPANSERCDWKEHAEISAVMRRLGARA